MISCSYEEIISRSDSIIQNLKRENISVISKQGKTVIGGGSLPEQSLPTKLVCIKPPGSLGDFAKKLRLSNPSLLGRIEKEYFILDPRSFNPVYDKVIVDLIKTVYLK